MMMMYTMKWCGRCVRLKHGLDQAGIRSSPTAPR